MIEKIAFHPLPGLSSPHMQTVIACFSKSGVEPPSTPLLVPLSDGDSLCCQLSTPPSWQETQKTIVLIHGLGGSQRSSYMVRLARKFYQTGYRVVRVNLRGNGPGAHLAKRPYHGGTSDDLLSLLQLLKQQNPDSPLHLFGFSLGGNVALKLAGELGEAGPALIKQVIAICPPVDLAHTLNTLMQPHNRWYQRYYLRGLKKLGARWLDNQRVNSMHEFDNLVTAPQWGFKNGADYYQQCSSCFLLPQVQVDCRILFAADDPFIDYRSVLQTSLPSSVKLWLTPHGGHMGFLGWVGREHRYFWLDKFLLEQINNK